MATKLNNFYTPGTEKFVSEPGDRYRIFYKGKVLDNGVVELVEDERVDVYAQIQADAEANSIPAILARFENGDDSALFQRQGMYGDFTDLPKTYAEFLQRQIDAEALWNKLDPSVRAKFDSDMNQFFASAGSPEWFDKLGYKKESDVKEEVKSDEP